MVDFIKTLKSAGQTITAKAREAIDWYKGKLQNILRGEKSKDPSKIFTRTASPEIGKMYMYVYDPKYKDILPFYDMYPLTIPIQFYDNGFLGLNLHYLPPLARASLLNALMSVANNNKYNDSTKLNISYDILKSYSNQFKGYESCVKRYLFAHVRSSFHIVSPVDWEKAVMLPLQRWKVNPNKRYAGSPPY
jgi:hypothetical protein